jgi:hypothetical protein
MPDATQPDAINAKLSHWDAMHQCFCGRWTAQRSPARSPEGVCYERSEGGVYVRTWRAEGYGEQRTYEWAGPSACEVCGYDLTRSPEANLAAIPPEEWAAGVIEGSGFDHEQLADFLPKGVEIRFSGCRLDNVQLGKSHSMLSTADSGRGQTCSHSRIVVGNDGQDWVARWKQAGAKGPGSPVQPVGLPGAVLDGRITDPADLPAEPMTESEMQEAQQGRERWKVRVSNARQYIAEDGWTRCACVEAWRAQAELDMNSVVDGAALAKRKAKGLSTKTLSIEHALPNRNCPLCGGIGALPPGREA